MMLSTGRFCPGFTVRDTVRQVSQLKAELVSRPHSTSLALSPDSRPAGASREPTLLLGRFLLSVGLLAFLTHTI